MIKSTALLAAAVLGVSASLAGAAAFTPGNLAIYRIGDGAVVSGTAARQVFIDEYSPAGTLVQSIQLSGINASGITNAVITAQFSTSTEGYLNRSLDGNYLILGGYNVAAGTAAPSGTASNPKAIARMSVQGAVDQLTTFTTVTGSTTAVGLRSVISPNGTDLYATTSSSANAVIYTNATGSGASPSVVVSGFTPRNLASGAGDMYISAASGTAPNLNRVLFTTGFPISLTPTSNTNVPASTTPSSTGTSVSPYGMLLLDVDGAAGIDTMYLADDSIGAIQKYELSSGAWVHRGNVTASGVRGLTGGIGANGVQLFATTAGSLLSVVDSSGFGGTLLGPITTLASAPTNTVFRGVAFTPIPEPAALGLLAPAALVLGRRRK